MYLFLCNIIKYSTMRYTYTITDSNNNIVEDNLNSYQDATDYLLLMQSQGIPANTFFIVKIEHYTVTGLGRDPDLH